MTDTDPNTTVTAEQINRIAASRMLTARLHVALKLARDVLALDPAKNKSLVVACDAALDHNEPEVLARIEDATRETKVERLVTAAQALIEATNTPPAIIVPGVIEDTDARDAVISRAFFELEAALRGLT